jgi:hypothetical protein
LFILNIHKKILSDKYPKKHKKHSYSQLIHNSVMSPLNQAKAVCVDALTDPMSQSSSINTSTCNQQKEEEFPAKKHTEPISIHNHKNLPETIFQPIHKNGTIHSQKFT